jgi:transposase InsO family protein
VHDDRFRRYFSAISPNRLWLADITEHRTTEGKLYLCALKDFYSNRIVGHDHGRGHHVGRHAAGGRCRTAGTTGSRMLDD